MKRIKPKDRIPFGIGIWILVVPVAYVGYQGMGIWGVLTAIGAGVIVSLICLR